MTKNTITATAAKTEFASLIDKARREPVTVTRNKRAVAVVLSPEEYERLSALEDSYWGERAKEAAKSGFLSEAESTKLIKDILDS